MHNGTGCYAATQPEHLMEHPLGLPDLDMVSDGSKITVPNTQEVQMGIFPATSDILKVNEERTESASRETFILAELIETEKAYVRDLREGIDTCMREMMTQEKKIPAGLNNMEHVIFGNLLELYEFHHKIFLKELKKHAHVPEDVGHCFVKWFQLYVDYCKNSDKSTRLIMEHTVNHSNKIQQNHGLAFSVQSFLIKPIQRMTKYPLLLKRKHQRIHICSWRHVAVFFAEHMLSLQISLTSGF
ncbi:triple functional domain protein-like isoform X2 [Corythoichthys intestinalis]|uniref:triple functional domain protein-like isoform X2 n=1 Tax=Corythoichthys intestinalis TaxID=161448 RepID=UPI0025A6513E|nr:triple functional domain protein-like isoform X2 [Corythoichthys intestinalis]